MTALRNVEFPVPAFRPGAVSASSASAGMRTVPDGLRASSLARVVAAVPPLWDTPRSLGRMDPRGWRAFADWPHREDRGDQAIDVTPPVTADHVPDDHVPAG